MGNGAGYSQAAGAIATNVGDAIMGSINSAAGMVGYLSSRKDTKPSWEYGYTPRVNKSETMRESQNVLTGGPQVSNFDPVDDYFKYSAVREYEKGVTEYAGVKEPSVEYWGREHRP
jgi:hypothetical protein